MRKVDLRRLSPLSRCSGCRCANATEVRLMTGPQGGLWMPLGGQLKDIWEKAIPGLQVQSLPGAGIANVRGIEEGKAEVGFANTISTADAVRAPAKRRSTRSTARSATSRRSTRSISRSWYSPTAASTRSRT